MAKKFYKLSLNDEAYKIFKEWEKKYFEFHNLNKNATVTQSDIIIDVAKSQRE